MAGGFGSCRGELASRPALYRTMCGPDDGQPSFSNELCLGSMGIVDDLLATRVSMSARMSSAAAISLGRRESSSQPCRAERA